MVVLSFFSVGIAAFATVMGLFLSFIWFFIFSKILEDRKFENAGNSEITNKDYITLFTPGIIYYVTVWVAAIAVEIFAK